MHFLSAWFFLSLAVLVPLWRFTPGAAKAPLLLLWCVGWLTYASPLTLAVVGGAAIATWAFGRWIASARAAELEPGVSERVLTARVRANIGSAVVIASVVALRLWGPMFGGLTIMAHPGVDEVAKLIGVAYLALKLHHYLRLVLFDPTQQLSPIGVLNYCLYLPTLSSGPILRVRDWREMIARDAPLGALAADLSVGIRRILWGLFKKVLAVPALVFASEIAIRQSAWWGAPALLILSLLIVYLDFSGYTDIAIGTGRTLGHRIRENFASPFLATSLSHFWRGWHITMGDWLREHIFVPLGGMRAGRAKVMAITLGTMLFCGLWHAFEWRFVAWGLYHGLLLCGERYWNIQSLPPMAPARKLWFRRFAVFVIMCGSGAFFIPQWWEWAR